MTSSPTTRRLTVAACALVAAAALTACGGGSGALPATTSAPAATTAPAAAKPAADAGAPSPTDATAAPGRSKRASVAADPQLVKVRREAAKIDLDAPGTRIERVDSTDAGPPGFLVTTWMGSAAVTIELFRATEDMPTACAEGDPGCVVEAQATSPNSLYYKARPHRRGDVLYSLVDVRLSYMSQTGGAWAARVEATGPDDDAFPAQDELSTTAVSLAMVLVDPKDVGGDH
ncbi:hypothetical protein [Kineosporia sp. A_224]|uniref:hypothetical protein n=1 Tax=Kineosporia sp. A_224 TaxID=1962180 RepID=UPI000B4BDEC2|nr:hypothetical protein [Kineosporia sp. A_224]